MQQPLLIMFLGSPGSGKSYFARQLAKRIHAVRLNGDAMRLAIYGSVENIERQVSKDVVNQQTFGAIDYVVEQILTAGCSVVYDAHHNKREHRAKNEEVAKQYGAVPVLVWIKTPYEVALRRGQDRDATADQRQHSEERMKESIARHMANFDAPADGERVIMIDGLAGFEKQYESYAAQLAAYI
jgi:predicted kinase